MCGSVPYFYPGDNNVADGELTFNYVDSELLFPWRFRLQINSFFRSL